MVNELKKETSLYLSQHQNNPVDWFPWGEKAFEIAKKDEKPIFLSIGYSSCHWCHVMEHESFEDKEVASLLFFQKDQEVGHLVYFLPLNKNPFILQHIYQR